MNKLLEKWPLMWKSRHEKEMQQLKDECVKIMNDKFVIDVHMTNVFNKLVEKSGAKLKLVVLENGFQAWEIDE